MRVEAQVLAARLRTLQQLGQRGDGAQKGAEIPHAVTARAEAYEPGVVDDADAGLAMPERNHPDPVAEAHVVIGGEAPRAEPAVGEPAIAAGGEVVDVPHVLPAAPDGRRRVLLVLVDETEALAQESRLPRGVEHPAAGHRLRAAFMLEGHLMVEVPQRDVPYPRGTHQARALRYRSGEEVLVERVPPELEGWHRAAEEAARLGGVGMAPHVFVGEPVAEALLGELLDLQVVPHREAAGEEHGRHLGGGLAHLGVEGGSALDHEHGQLGLLAPEQNGRGGAREGPAEDDHVEATHGLHSSAPPAGCLAPRALVASGRSEP